VSATERIERTREDSGSRGTEGRTRRRIGRLRGLPGGRAVVGALLVTAAAVGTFAVHLNAIAEAETEYLVALASAEPGTRFASVDEVRATFGSAGVELTAPLAERAIPVSEIEGLVGHTLVAPLERGDLVSRTAVVEDGGVAPAQTMSFPVGRTAAVGGALRAGERVDVLATYGSGEAAYTAFVVRGVPLLRVSAPDGSSVPAAGGGSDLTLTVAVTELEDVQRLGHAVSVADLFVTRSTAVTGDDGQAPGAYVAEPAGRGVVPDPASSAQLSDPEPPGSPEDADHDAGGDS
jgi:hypothetical protein